MKPTTEGPDLLSAWLWQVVGRQWGWLVGLTAIGLGAALAWYLAATPLYPASVLVRIGYIHQYGVLEGARALAADLEATLAAPAAASGCRVESSFVEPAVEPTDSLVTLTVTCPVAARAVELVRAAVEPVTARHAQAWEQLVGQGGATSALSRPTKLLRAPVVATTPAQPARVMIVLGAVLGFVVGLLVAALRQAMVRRPSAGG